MRKLFHLSENNLHGKYLSPRVPQNYMTKHGYEENKTPRVCFSTSIQGALIAMSSNLLGKTFFVHEPWDYKGLDIVTNETIVKNKLVPDAHLTKETWVLKPVKLRLVKIITVTDVIDKPLKYTYGDNKSAELYGWKYKEEPMFLYIK